MANSTKEKRSAYDKEFLAGLFKTIYTIRVFEKRGIQLYRQGLIRGYFHPYLGEEAIATGLCAALRKGEDYIASTHRGHGHCIAYGAELAPMLAELMGRSGGYCRGRGGSMHIADVTTGNLGANGIVGATIPLALGAALAISIRGEDRVAVAFSSDGGTCNGVFGEGLNLAGAWKAPLILIVENNQYAVSTPITASTAEPELWKRGPGMGIESYRVDGNNVLEVYEHTLKAAEHCRAGEGPVLIEALTYRHGGHHVNDPGLYMPKDKLEYYMSIDPLTVSRGFLKDIGGADDAECDAIMAEVEEQYEEALEGAMASPEPSVEEFLKEVEAL